MLPSPIVSILFIHTGAGRAGGVGMGGRWERGWGVEGGGAPSESITESNRFSLLGFETGKYLMEN